MNTITAHILTTLHVLGTKLKREEKGATAVEYGLMVAGIAIVIIGGVWALGGGLDTLFKAIGGALPKTVTTP